jgi:DNA (cytosine-5)-methyltransferase 1
MKYFSMFTGVGGFELGIQKAFEKWRRKDTQSKRSMSDDNSRDKRRGWNEQSSVCVCSRQKSSKQTQCLRHKRNIGNITYPGEWDNKTTYNENRFECIGFSEIDKWANELLKRKFPKVKNYGDATKINPKELPDFEMLCGGFPCQSFSIAGQRLGFEDTRGTLFFDIARIIKVKRPRIVFLENVKGLLNHDNGRTFAVILATLDELGYNVEWEVLNSKYFGVPQNRERVFIIGHLRGTSSRQIFPIGKIAKGNDEEDTEKFKFRNESIGKGQQRNGGNISQPILEDGNRKDLCLRELTEGESQGMRVYDSEGVSTTIAAKAGGLGAKTGLYAIDLYNKKLHSDRTPALTEPHHNTLRLMQNQKIRRLTPLECERLQGFPDNWTEGFSDTQRYRMMGNAVTVNVIQAIAEKMMGVNSQLES